MKFIVDHMLGKLAKYLRFMGYDTFYPTGKMSDDELLNIAEREGRIIITRDRELAQRSGGFFVESDNYREQLKEVIKKFKLTNEALLSRCSLCNEPLIKLSKDKARGKVPEYVWEHNTEFYLCPRCGRVYWYGTHTEKIEKLIKELMEDEQ